MNPITLRDGHGADVVTVTGQILVSLGADPAITDEEHHSTPAGWADHHGHDEVAAWLTARVGLPTGR